ncbi:LysR family transcriptional regulator [Piscinibacter sp. HJYY11]|uniref:LysR family transcriptional regulator n=1 Tax=Piscinibacter sp. HJYY11 TaxID=2801333 RepID=UPI00191F2880|nr:LysR family transcriptional regulator [Piscinibacter sp. HJYY11]MBL0727864.1 LysR family transcriptional regulator [Piscinibacter sp. HJYY11]
MDSDALATFLAVHRRGGVSAAADELARTQSAISRRLALLEQEVGAPLFERIGRGLVLSEVGAALLPYAERVAAAIGDAKAAAESARTGAGGTVQVVTVGTLANASLATALKRAQARQPGLDLRLQTATSAEVSSQVRSGAASIGLRYFDDAGADLECRVVQTERLVVVSSASHPLAGKRVKSLSQLAGERWLAFPAPERRSEAFATTVLAQFTSRGIDRPDWIAIDSLTAQKRMVEAGFGLALLQASAIEEERTAGSLAVLRVDDLDVSVPVVLVTRRGGYLSGGAQAVLRELLPGRRSR